MLIYKQKTIRFVECHDLERFIDEEFGIGFREKFELAPIEETNNYSYKSFNVDGEMKYSWDLKSINEMLQTKEYKHGCTRVILEYLCSQGKIEPGNYMVDVSW